MRSALLVCALTAACGAAPAWSADAAIGRAKAAACAACHGPMGVAVVPDAPNLAGQPAEYIVAQLKAYRDGARKHEVMSLIAKPLSNDDMATAAWFASLKVQVQPVP